MQNKNKKYLGLILALAMLLSFLPAVPALAETPILDMEQKAREAITLAVEEDLHPPTDISSLKLFSEDTTSEEERYVEEVAKALKTPKGSVGISLLPEEPAVFMVWLQELPKALSEFYGVTKTRQLTQDFARQAMAARYTIQTTYSNTIRWEYSHVFSGFALEMLPSEAEALSQMPGIYAVTPDSLMHIDAFTPDPNYRFDGMRESREAFRMAEIHNHGYTGKGVVVAVLDTGIDYNHPDLKDAYRGGYNYVQSFLDTGRPANLKNDPMETTYAQWKASGEAETDREGNSFYTDHGTHVSGTIAAQAKNNNSTYKALGIAPDVNLYVGRVIGPYGYGATSDLVAAVDDFSKGNKSRGIPKADVINISLGSGVNSAYGSDVYALNNAVIAGVNVAISAGNGATPGEQTDLEWRQTATLDSPGTAYLPVTVAASQYGGASKKTYSNVFASQNGEATNVSFPLSVEGQHVTNSFQDHKILGNPAPVYIEGKGYPAYLAIDANDETSAQDLQSIPANSLSGQILIVKRGLYFQDYLTEALRAGAGALIVVNNEGQEEFIGNMDIGGVSSASLPLFSSHHATSAKLRPMASEDRLLYLELGQIRVAPQAALPAYFSALGPVRPTIGLKPDIMAPGWDIVSTVPAFSSSPAHNAKDYSAAYRLLSGTSMAAPHVAGILALLVQRYPDAAPWELKARLMNTANTDRIRSLENGTAASVLEQGAGFADPYRALVENNVVVTVKDDIPGLTSDQPIVNQRLSSMSFGTVKQGKSSRSIQVSVQGASSFTVDVLYNNKTRFSKDASKNNVTLSWGPVSKGRFDVTASVPSTAAQGSYEGWLRVKANGRASTIPWLLEVGETEHRFDMFAVVERPVISTSRDDTVRATGGTAPKNSNATSVWFAWEGGAWPLDQGAGTRNMRIFLLDVEHKKPMYMYRSRVNMAGQTNDGRTLFVAPNMVSDRALPINDGVVAETETVIRNGAYCLGFSAGDYIYYLDELGVVFSDGKGKEQVVFDLKDIIYVSDDPEVNTGTVRGRIFSPALQKATEAGFKWTTVENFWTRQFSSIDQRMNVIGFQDTTTGVLKEGNRAYHLFQVGGDPYVCDKEGYFTLSIPVQASDKNDGYVFSDGSHHTVVGVEAFSQNDDGDLSPFVGGNQSRAVTPRFRAVPLDRIEGISRYETAVAVSRRAYRSSNVAVIAYGHKFPDALSGGVLASRLQAPLLLIRDEQKTVTLVLEELSRLGAKTVYLLGGEKVIATKLENKIRSKVKQVIRLAGDNRYATAFEIAKEIGVPPKGHVFVVNGTRYFDALSIGPVAAREGIPILLTDPTILRPELESALKNLNVAEITLIGGEKAISLEIENSLSKRYRVKRVAGETREETALAIARQYFTHPSHFLIATATDELSFADGLVGGYFGALDNAPLLLVRNNKGVHESVIRYLKNDVNLRRLTLLGGPKALSEAIEESLIDLLLR